MSEAAFIRDIKYNSDYYEGHEPAIVRELPSRRDIVVRDFDSKNGKLLWCLTYNKVLYFLEEENIYSVKISPKGLEFLEDSISPPDLKLKIDFVREI